MTNVCRKARRSLAKATAAPMMHARISLSTLTGTLGILLGFSGLINDTHAYMVKHSHHHHPIQCAFLPEDTSTPMPMLSISHGEEDCQPKQQQQLSRIGSSSTRRRLLLLDTMPNIAAALSLVTITGISSFPLAAVAAEDSTESSSLFVQRGDGFAYRFVPPAEMEAGAKPVKTHMFEINWKSPTNSKYTFGVTVDPVRIQNLKEVSYSWLVS
jgi:hypothetical protein